LGAVETIVGSANHEKAKFMEGASWIAKKTHIETEKHVVRVQDIVKEFEKRAKDYVIDQSIFELDGRSV